MDAGYNKFIKELLRKAYLSGWNQSGEGYNAEMGSEHQYAEDFNKTMMEELDELLVF